MPCKIYQRYEKYESILSFVDRGLDVITSKMKGKESFQKEIA